VRARLRLVVQVVAARAAMELRRLRFRREAAVMGAERSRRLRDLGDAVHRHDAPEIERARARVAKLDALLAEKAEELRSGQAELQVRIEQAHLEGGATERRPSQPGGSAVELPPNVPEPEPVPSDPPGPVIVPEPEPVPHVPPGPVIVPEPQPPDQ